MIGTAEEDELEAQATALLSATEPEDDLEPGEKPQGNADDSVESIYDGAMPDKPRRAVHRVVYVCVDVGGRELLKAEREFLTEFGDLLLRRKMWFGGCGIGGSPWLTTRAGTFLERLHLRTEEPDTSKKAGARWAWVECRVAKKPRGKSKTKGAKSDG